MLSIRNIHAGYNGNEILHGVTLDVVPNSIMAIIGPNGSGKSTLLKSVFGLCDVTKGKIVFKDQDITRLPTFDLISEGVSMVPQGRPIFSQLTIRENLEMAAYTITDPDVRERHLKEALHHFPFLSNRLNESASNLSGGQRQMLAIAMALMQNPQLLLLDEPSLGLSPKAQKELFETIQKMNQEGVTILLVEQNAKQAVQIANQTVVLENGQIALQAGKEILKNPRIKNIYLGGE